jgi:hypothetical protein
MPDNISLDVLEILNQTNKTFSNLLKEFPKNAGDDFIYDESTLEKISHANIALDNITPLADKILNDLGEKNQILVKDPIKSFSRLMAELPRDPADEFLYDRMVHQLVEAARETVVKLNRLIS